jgi:NADPH:quinone reductase-like Zn-dependent oxidoreductase
VLIRVYAAAVNPVDWKMRNGMNRGGGAPRGEGGPPGGGAPGAGGPPGAPPGAGPGGPPGGGSTTAIPGMDVAGVVEKLGSGVTNVKVGDAVFSMLGRGVGGMNGGYSQYALAPSGNVVAKPKNITYAQAAGLGTAGMTGVRAVNGANVSKGQKVLILGVAGGVGSAAAQIAKARGATVVGTASARHNAYLKTIGVDQVIDYTKGSFEDQVKNVDVVINTVTGDSAERSLKTLKKGGTFASVAGNVAADKCAAAGVKCAAGGPPGPGGPSEGDMLAEVGKLVSAGKYGVNVDKTFPLEKAADAQIYSFDGHAEGKIILIVDAANANKK